MTDHSEDIARLIRARESLLKEGSETGRPVYLSLRGIERSIAALRAMDAESAYREYNPHEAAERDQQQARERGR